MIARLFGIRLVGPDVAILGATTVLCVLYVLYVLHVLLFLIRVLG